MDAGRHCHICSKHRCNFPKDYYDLTLGRYINLERNILFLPFSFFSFKVYISNVLCICPNVDVVVLQAIFVIDMSAFLKDLRTSSASKLFLPLARVEGITRFGRSLEERHRRKVLMQL